MTYSKYKNRYRHEIDGLRALAIIAVIINHFNNKLFPNGYLGVDIFFVISGYVITSSIAKRKYNNFMEFIIGFYSRRIKRLMPALIFFIVILSICICLFNPDPKWTLRSSAASLFGINNIFLYWRSTDYFAESTYLNPFSHTWSLGIEEQFYLFFPWLVWFTGFQKGDKKSYEKLLFWISLISITSLCLFSYLYINEPSAAYYLLPTRIWEISLGCIVFIIIENNYLIVEKLKKVSPSFIVLLMLCIMSSRYTNNSANTIIIVLLTSIIICSINEKSRSYNLFTNKFIKYIGLRSYSLYLWHWGIISISRWTIGIYWWTLFLQVPIIIVISELSYRYIETTFRKKNILKGKQIGFISLTFAGLITLTTIPIIKQLSSLPNRLYSGKDMNRERQTARSPGNGLIIDNRNQHTKTIYGIGDSHLGHFYPIFKRLNNRINFNLHITGWGLGAGNVNANINIWDPKYLFKNRYEDIVGNSFYYHIKDIKQGDIVIISISTLKLDNTMSFTKEEKIMFEQIAIESYKKGVNMILINQTPFFRGGVYDLCEENWYRPSFSIPKDCLSSDRELLKTKTREVNTFYNDLSLKYSNVYVLDAFEVLCPKTKDRCPVVINGNYLYSDGDHLTNYGSEIVYEDFYNLIVKNNLL